MELIALNELHHELGVRLGAVVSLSRSTWILTASQEGNNSSLLNMLSWVNEIKDCEKAVEMLAVAKQQPLIYSGKCHSSKICQMLFLVVFQRPFNVLHPSVWLLCKTGVKRKYFFQGISIVLSTSSQNFNTNPDTHVNLASTCCLSKSWLNSSLSLKKIA